MYSKYDCGELVEFVGIRGLVTEGENLGIVIEDTSTNYGIHPLCVFKVYSIVGQRYLEICNHEMKKIL